MLIKDYLFFLAKKLTFLRFGTFFEAVNETRSPPLVVNETFVSSFLVSVAQNDTRFLLFVGIFDGFLELPRFFRYERVDGNFQPPKGIH